MTKTLHDAEKKLQQAKALVQQLRAREKENVRKLDTRRKIILGGLLIAEAKADLMAQMRLQERIESLSDNEKKVFENWHV